MVFENRLKFGGKIRTMRESTLQDKTTYELNEVGCVSVTVVCGTVLCCGQKPQQPKRRFLCSLSLCARALPSPSYLHSWVGLLLQITKMLSLSFSPNPHFLSLKLPNRVFEFISFCSHVILLLYYKSLTLLIYQHQRSPS